MYSVALLPGHGYSIDPGAVNKITGAIESKGNLSVGLKLKILLEYNGIKVKMSRTTETACDNAKTVSQDVNNQINFINNSGCNIAVALHFNSFNKESHGVEVLYSSVNPGYNQNTVKLAQLILDELVKETGLFNRGLKLTNSGVGVIKRSRIPVVLSESAFVSNDVESIWCTSDEHNYRLAKAHAKAICQYFDIQFKEPNQKEDIIPKVIIGDKTFEGLLYQSSVIVPIRTIAEYLGFTVDFNKETKEVTVNGVKIKPIIIENVSYCSIRYLFESLQYKVNFDNETKTTTVYK